MNPWDYQGRKLAEEQASLFEASLTHFRGSSPVFIRLFMNSKLTQSFDDRSFLSECSGLSYSELGLPSANGAQRGNGQSHYSANQLHWLGYLYRYWAYTRSLTSVQVYRLCPASKLVPFYEPLHTQDPEGAIQTIEQAIHYVPPKEINAIFLENYRSFRKKEKAGLLSGEKSRLSISLSKPE
jgi:hypothetical protein